MLEEETSINVEKTKIRSLLEEFKIAVNRPRFKMLLNTLKILKTKLT